MAGELNPSQDELDRLFDGQPIDDRPLSVEAARGAVAPTGGSAEAFDQAERADFGSGSPGSEPFGAPGAAGLPELEGPSSVSTAQFAALAPQQANGHDAAIDLLLDVTLQISVELGRTRMTIGEILALRSGAVIELDKLAGEPADILVNGTLIARGEVVVVDDKFGVRVLEVVSRAKRLASLA